MKRLLSLSLSMVALSALAQHTYTNAQLTSTSDVIGTARYVGMGGALGALGADMSAISSNPASIGLYRKNDVSLTAGGLWPSNRAFNEAYGNSAHGTFDQMGFVTSWSLDGGNMRRFNFAFNYQKKFNHNAAFYADNANLGGISQADQIADLSNNYFVEENITGTAYNAYVTDKDDVGYYNSHSANSNEFTHYSTGSTQAFDINFSGNVLDQYYWGVTLGIDNVDYDKMTTYTEFRDGKDGSIQDYTLYNDQHVSGFGVNLKVGTVIRPIEDNPLRFGFTVETPTWYDMKSSVYHSIDSRYDMDGNYQQFEYKNHEGIGDNYLEYKLRSPWRVRLSAGSTVENFLAWGLEYEYANYTQLRQSYPNDDYYGYGGSLSGSTKDVAMNDLTKQNMRAQHTFKMGFEVKPTSNFAIRVGYNYSSSIFKDVARLNQNIDSYAMDFSTSTDYMNLSDVSIITGGLGYKYKRFYADLAYKYRIQSGKFYAFDDSFTGTSQFIQDNPNLANMTLQPVDVNLNRHSITCTLGFKF